MPKKYDLVIIGGGAAGLIAAISAARNGAKTVILERMKRVGKKILASGNGKCNFANFNLQSSNFHGQNPHFVKSVFRQFGLNDTLQFFETLGLSWKKEKDGSLFPITEKSSSILNILRYEIRRLKITEKCDWEVKSIRKDKTIFTIESNKNEIFRTEKVILATGGMTASYLGSNGSGFDLAKKLGHTIGQPFPALVQIRLKSPFLKHLAGMNFDGKLQLLSQKKILQEEQGEILFTKYGISGLPALKISRKIGESNNLHKIQLSTDFFPNISLDEIKKLLTHRFELLSYKKVGESFEGFLNKKLAFPILKDAGVDFNKTSKNISCKEIDKIAKILKGWRFKITGTNSWRDAQVTAGGISTKEVNKETLESKIISGLFFAGEILDIDGDTGGFNLQWAWSSGFVAGKFVILP
ncbi:MAG: NAD(P)/FAD-dependent oxidoreductase [Candidatus Cloacimonadota bacterium]|nr:NAD(P)/FAD-dependent oxidoreductase [Candidatus Cloacimonadota bacterium]